MKETYTREEMLAFKVTEKDLEDAIRKESKCNCFSWVRFLCACFYYCSNFLVQWDHCKQHNTFFFCDGPTSCVEILKRRVPTQISSFWTKNSRTGIC